MPQPKSQAPLRRRANQSNEIDSCPDDFFLDQLSDEDAARDWLANIYWPDGVRCPECLGCHVTALGHVLNPTHQCNACNQIFSITTRTLMDGLDTPLQQWLYGMFVFTQNPYIATPRKLAERVTGDYESAQTMAYRLLQAADEPVVRLREPAELDWTYLHYPVEGTSDKPLVVSLIGRKSRRVAGLRMILTDRRANIQDFVSEHLVEGMALYADDHQSNRVIPGVVKHLINHSKGQFAYGPACTNRVEALWRRLKRVLHTDDSWYRERCLTAWLDGIKWQENHRHLPHLGRVELLAKGMRWKSANLRQDRFRIQKMLGQPDGQPCGDCCNFACLVESKKSMWSHRIPRTDQYQARRAG